MIKKIFTLILCAAVITTALLACGCSGDDSVKLDKPTNIAFEDGILSYDAVENAEGYDVIFKHGEDVVYEDRIADTAIDVESLGLGGTITVTVSAYKGEVKGEALDYTFVALSTFGEVVFEAEDYLANFGTGTRDGCFRNNSLAHKGAYVGGIDDAGQGVYINYLCPVAGTYDFTAYYTTDMAPAHNDVWVNGSFSAKFDFTEKTGWGGTGVYDAAPATVKITLLKGWNTISVMKNGDEKDNYGSFAELDYFVLKGNGEKYNMDDLLSYGVRPESYILEAEMGSPRKKMGSGIMGCKNPSIQNHGSYTFSNGFLMGAITSKYEGVEWHFNSPVKAKYRIRICYGTEGSASIAPTFIVTQTQVAPLREADFYDYEQKKMNALAYSTAAEKPVLSEEWVEITLEAGKNFIYCVLMEDLAEGGELLIDYAELTFIEEITE